MNKYYIKGDIESNLKSRSKMNRNPISMGAEGGRRKRRR
jgi:hypothetical protein